MPIILNNEFSQVLQHDAHEFQDIVVRRAENPQSKFLQTSVTACVIVRLLVVGTAVYCLQGIMFFILLPRPTATPS